MDISYSRLKVWNQGCPKMYRYRYIDKVPLEATRAMNLGTVVHQAIERFAVARLCGWKAAADDVNWAILDHAVTKGKLEADSVAELKCIDAEGDSALLTLLASYMHAAVAAKLTPALVRDGLRMCLRYLAMPYADPGNLPWFREVIAIERSFSVELGDHRLTGVFDRVDRVGPDLVVVDYKTGRSLPDATQMALYQYAARKVWPYPDVYLVETTWWFLLDGRTTDLQSSAWMLQDCVASARLACAQIARATLFPASHRADFGFPANPDAERCSRCDYKEICEERAND